MFKMMEDVVIVLGEGVLSLSSALFPFHEYVKDDKSAYEAALLDILKEVKIMSSEAEVARMTA